ncbi:MAG: helicase-related protein [Spirochaetales bacterium]|nr:helicase-related protein [Spirochaetales bacterium]
MLISEIKQNVTIIGLEQDNLITIQAVAPISESSVTVFYTGADGNVKSRLITKTDAENLSIAQKQLPYSFDGNAEEFKLVLEAKRIEYAYLFDPMMAVHSAKIEPLPHQISAVYEAMLPKRPLRFVLADDPGAGKTIMAGLLIRELIIRSDSHRILVVAPGSLVEQWREELWEKFNLDFTVYTNALSGTTQTGNPYTDFDRLIVRLDQFSRNEEEQAKIAQAEWDLVIFDEAHKLAAQAYGEKINKTQRFRFAERMRDSTKHLLLMTATPHNGKEEDFQLFMSLLDAERFAGKFRNGVKKVETSDLMRRMIKEDLRRFDGTPLFPERKAYTVEYSLSEKEMELYEQVTDYVKDQMGKAQQILEGKKKASVGFALTSLQRRLASSPEAIYMSLERRLTRMNKLLDELINGKKEDEVRTLQGTLDTKYNFSDDNDDDCYDDEDLTGEEQEEIEDQVADEATVARSKEELQAEIETLESLLELAKDVVAIGQDSKWTKLREVILGTHEKSEKNLLLAPNGKMRKLIIFTEYKDTLLYLQKRIEALLGTTDSTSQVVTICGSTGRDERKDIQARFRTDENVRILIATDAAGEGVNLQNAHLMINYDLPWNPNRLEQRFGRIHRIGQTEVCHLWSLVAAETREGAVYKRLLEKIEVENEALEGKVFKILGDVFQERSLKDMLIEAIQYGDDPKVKARLENDIDLSFDPQHLKELIEQNALASQALTNTDIYKIKEEMDKAEARKLQPYYIRDFFVNAFDHLNGTYRQVHSEPGRYEIKHVPAVVIETFRTLKEKNKGHVDSNPVQPKYERVCFEKYGIRIKNNPDAAVAELLHPGHPLMYSLTQTISQKFENLLKQGTVFLTKNEYTERPYILYMFIHEIKDGTETVISKRFQFVRMNPDGTTTDAGYAPHLDLLPFPEDKKYLLKNILAEEWLTNNFADKAIKTAVEKSVPEHYEEVAKQKKEYIKKVKALVHERLTTEINYQNKMYQEQYKKGDKGNAAQTERRIEELNARLDSRKKLLDKQGDIVNQQPVLIGAALVVTQQQIDILEYGMNGADDVPSQYSVDAQTRRQIELIGMKAVCDIETKTGNTVHDVSKDNCGWDITSTPKATGKQVPDNMLIEVKARVSTNDVITVTHNEYLAGLNKGKQYTLALVLVNGNDKSVEEVWYWKNPFTKELPAALDHAEFNIDEIKKLGIRKL